MQPEYLANPDSLINKVVRCIDDLDAKIYGLIQGNAYTVVRLNTYKDSCLVSGNGNYWHITRFEVIESSSTAFNVGTKVICIDNDGASSNLILNNTYSILEVTTDADEGTVYRLNDNSGVFWLAKRFKLASSEEKVSSKPIDSSIDLEEERLRAIFLTSPPDTCFCGAPKFACKYH